MQRTAVDGYDWFQRELKGIEAGDIFAIPLRIGGYGFGRVVNAHPGASLAEFFRFWADAPAYAKEIADSGRLFPPTGFSVSDIAHRNRKRPWRVIHKDPHYYPADLYDLKFSQSHDGRNWTYYTLNDHWQTLGRISVNDVDEWEVPSRLPEHPDQIMSVVEYKLKNFRIFPSEAS